VGVQEGIDQRFHHLDTTSFSLSGAYAPESDEHALIITHGSSKDHRPDLKQAVLELMVSQDGGGPLMSRSWDGNTSEIQVFQERAQALMETFKKAPSPRYLVADAKLSHADNAPNLQSLRFITRIPHTLQGVSQGIGQALAVDTWQHADAQTRSQCLELCHFGLAQRWLVVRSEAAAWRAESTIRQAPQREYEASEKQLFHLHARRFDTPASAQEAFAPWAKKWKDHQVDSYELLEHKRYGQKGRPRADTPCQAIAWQMQARVRPDAERIGYAMQLGACYGLGTTIEAAQLSDVEVIGGYKGQAKAEGGFRFLKAPLFFVSSLFVKKPCRIQGLLRVMTLALLVYAVAQRRLRQA